MSALHSGTAAGVNASQQTTSEVDPGRSGDLVSVVIVNFNAGDYLAAAVESVLSQAEVATEVIVVDNASSDDSLASLRGRAPESKVRVI